MYAAYPNVKIVTAWIDEALNEKKYIVPGLGGAQTYCDLPDQFELTVNTTRRLWRPLLHLELSERDFGDESRRRPAASHSCNVRWTTSTIPQLSLTRAVACARWEMNSRLSRSENSTICCIQRLCFMLHVSALASCVAVLPQSPTSFRRPAHPLFRALTPPRS